MRWTWSFWGRWRWWVPTMGALTVEGRGMRALSQILSDESLSYSLKHISTGDTHFTFHGGALISYISISCFHDDSSNGSMFRVTGFSAGNSPVTAGNSPVTGVTQTSDAELWCLLWSAPEQTVVNNQDAGELKRHSAHYDATVMWRRIVIQWSGQPWDDLAFNASSCPILNWWNVNLGGSVHMEGMASNLAHCSNWLPFFEINYNALSGS